MAKFIIEFVDTADGGIDINFDEVDAEENSMAIPIGRACLDRLDRLIDSIRED